jgi:hypothetical protein
MYVLDMTERDGKLFIPEIDVFVNDLSLPLWAAIPPREAARIAIETSEALDRRLEGFPPALLEEIYVYNKRWVVRALHRGEHLDDVDAALKRLSLGNWLCARAISDPLTRGDVLAVAACVERVHFEAKDAARVKRTVGRQTPF